MGRRVSARKYSSWSRKKQCVASMSITKPAQHRFTNSRPGSSAGPSAASQLQRPRASDTAAMPTVNNTAVRQVSRGRSHWNGLGGGGFTSGEKTVRAHTAEKEPGFL